MDVCPIPFGIRAPLLPRLIPTGGTFTYADPNLSLDIDFAESMDQTEEPPLSAFVIEVDGVDKTPVGGGWFDATTYQLTYSEAVLGPTVIYLRYSKKYSTFLSLTGELVTPFNIQILAA